MPPKITSTSSWTSLVAQASAALSVVSLSSRWSSTCRSSRPPPALISSITIFATFASAMPMKERGPVWSVMTPTFTLGVIAATALCDLRRSLVSGFLHDRRDLGVGDEALPALVVPVEEHPDAVLLVGVAEDLRALGAVRPSLVGALRREDAREPFEVLDGRCGQNHLYLQLVDGASICPRRWV